MIDLVAEVKALALRFDNELGSANGGAEGSVKRHIRKIQEDMAEIKEVIVGNGDKLGLAGKVLLISSEFTEHKIQDRFLFGISIVMLGWIIVKLYHL